MGNCMDLFFPQPQEKIRVLIFNGGEEQFDAQTTIDHIVCGPYHDYMLVHQAELGSPLSCDGKLACGKVYYLMPCMDARREPPVSQKMNDEGDRPGSLVKVKVSQQQLKWLLGGNAKLSPDVFTSSSRVIESCSYAREAGQR
ncbi:hypothetical protein ACLOJK_035686 [Asimina triloba]